jgi:hypothetical protein
MFQSGEFHSHDLPYISELMFDQNLENTTVERKYPSGTLTVTPSGSPRSSRVFAVPRAPASLPRATHTQPDVNGATPVPVKGFV